MDTRHIQTIADLLAKEAKSSNDQIIKLNELIKESKKLRDIKDLISEKRHHAEILDAYTMFMNHEWR